VQAVYMEVDVDPKQQQAEADELIAICKKGDAPTTAAVISAGRPPTASRNTRSSSRAAST